MRSAHVATAMTANECVAASNVGRDSSDIFGLALTLEALRRGVKLTHPSIFLTLNFCSLTDCQKLWHNCSLFVNTSFDTN